MVLRAKTRQDALMTRQDAPKTRQDAPRRFQDAPKTPQGRAKTRPRRAKTSQDARRCSQDASKTVFCSILMDLGSIFDGLYTLKRVLVSRCRLYKHIVKLMKTHCFLFSGVELLMNIHPKIAKLLWLEFGASEALLARRFPLFYLKKAIIENH